MYSVRAQTSDRPEKQQMAFVLLALYPQIGFILTEFRRELSQKKN
jgi:hypothetical protein